MQTLRFSVLTLSLSVLTLYMLFLHERTVSSVTDVSKKVIKVLSQLSRRQCRSHLKLLRLNLIQGLKPASKNLQLLPFVQTQQGVAVNAEHLAVGKCTQQSPFFTATYVVRLMPLRRATQIPLNKLWSMGMFFCSQAMKSPRPVWAFGVNDRSSVGSSFIFFMMFLLLKIYKWPQILRWQTASRGGAGADGREVAGFYNATKTQEE